MASANSQFNDEKELLLSRIKDLEFVDDVSGFKCKRCEKVLIQHYISDCGHAFCYNCKKLLGDGSGRWPCPECQQFIKEIDFQDYELEKKLFDLRVGCANKKYGCPLTCLVKELGEHLKSCEFTRENALPVPYEKPSPIEAILKQLSAFNKTFDEINANIESIEEKIIKIESNQETFDNKLKTLDNRLDAVNLAFPQEIQKLNVKNEDSKHIQVPDELISSVDSMKSEILNLNKKSDFWLEVLEMKEEKINKTIDQLKQELEDDNDTLNFALQDEIERNAKNFREELDELKLKTEDKEKQIENISKKLGTIESAYVKLQSSIKSSDEEKAQAKINKIENQVRLEMRRLTLLADSFNTMNSSLKMHGERLNKIEPMEDKINSLSLKIKDNSDVVNKTISDSNNQFKTDIEINKIYLTSINYELSLVAPELNRLESYINLMKLQVQPFPLKDAYLNWPSDFVWQIPDVNNLLKPGTLKDLVSEEFRLMDYPWTARAIVSFTADSLCVSVSFNNESTIQLQPSIYLNLRNQVHDRQYDILKLASKNYQSPQNGDYEFTKIAKSKLSGFLSLYVNDNNLQLEFHVEPPSIAKHVYSYDGTLNWVIHNYKSNQALQSEDKIDFCESPYFYTTPHGYRVQIRFWLGYTEHVFASIHFLSGEFDSDLKQEIPHQFTITYLNKYNSSRHVTESIVYDPVMFKSTDFDSYCRIAISKTDIKSVLTRDTLYCHVKVEAI